MLTTLLETTGEKMYAVWDDYRRHIWRVYKMQCMYYESPLSLAGRHRTDRLPSQPGMTRSRWRRVS